MNISKRNSIFSQFSWASLFLGCGLLVLLNTSADATSVVDESPFILVQQVIDAPHGPQDGSSDQTQFVEAIEEVELSDESQDDESSFKKQLEPYSIAFQTNAFTGFFVKHAPRGSVIATDALPVQQKLFLAYHQLKIDC